MFIQLVSAATQSNACESVNGCDTLFNKPCLIKYIIDSTSLHFDGHVIKSLVPVLLPTNNQEKPLILKLAMLEVCLKYAVCKYVYICCMYGICMLYMYIYFIYIYIHIYIFKNTTPSLVFQYYNKVFRIENITN